MRKFRGIVCTGVGRGRYFLSLKIYRRALKEKLGFVPYAGTLNLKVEEKWVFERLGRGDRVGGFKRGKREFGGVMVLRGRMKEEPVGILLPDRTVHRDVVEIVARRNLRKLFGLKDGDEVWVEIE